MAISPSLVVMDDERCHCPLSHFAVRKELASQLPSLAAIGEPYLEEAGSIEKLTIC